MTNRRVFPGMLLLAAMPVILLATGFAGPAAAQGIDSVFKDFKRTGKYLLAVNGKPVPAAEIYLNESIPAYMVITPSLPSPVLLTPGSNMAVEAVPMAKIVRQPDGTVALTADADPKPQGQFKVEGEKVVFASGGRNASLAPNPPLLGVRNAPALKNHSPEYMVTARNYKPNGQALAVLKKQATPVKVRVFFGSWCPHCQEHLPFLMRVQDELGASSKIQFEYYGLPPRFTNDPEAKKYNVDGVPLGIVLVNGKEVGRIRGGNWSAPETALSNILRGKATASR